MKHRPLSDIKRIILHCSMSNFGDAETIDRWHKEEGWDMIGYHYVIGNGFKSKKDIKAGVYLPTHDGRIEMGRSMAQVGAHARGYNSDSLGICLIGDRLFTAGQTLVALPKVIKYIENILGRFLDIDLHNQLDGHKYCPGFNDGVLKVIKSMVRP